MPNITPSIALPPTPTRSLVPLALLATLTGACHDPAPAGGDAEPGTTTGEVGSTDDGTESPYVCRPGQVRCAGQAFLETCAPTGLSWVSEPCGTDHVCEPCSDGDACAEARCVGPCEVEADLPSSAGCSFIANRQLHLNENSADGLVVTNPHDERLATVQLYRTPINQDDEQPVGLPRVLEPGEHTLFSLDDDFVTNDTSILHNGGTYRVQSDVPVIAYQHSPLVTDRGNDSSMLLPETTLRRDYVVFSFPPHEEQAQGQGEPSYFEIVALEEFTQVQWTPPVDTAGNGVNVVPVPAGETSPALTLNRFDTVRIAASANFQPNADLRDVSGTVIHATKPIWVMGASRCSRVPVQDEPELGRCDPLQELLIPLDYWGEHYVAAHPPLRDSERHWWRIYSATSGVRITARGNEDCTGPIITPSDCTAPNTYDDGACILAQRGSWIQVDVDNGCSFVLDSEDTGAFMPVGYLQSSRSSGEPAAESTAKGDPSMYQTIPVEQFLGRYVFSTGVGMDQHLVQVIREAGGPSVFLDGMGVGAFYPVDETYEVADVSIAEGSHIIESAAPFGIVQFGYTSGASSPACNNELGSDVCHASYAYPGGMRSEPIYVP